MSLLLFASAGGTAGTFGPATETDLAQAIIPAEQHALTQAVETDAAQAITAQLRTTQTRVTQAFAEVSGATTPQRQFTQVFLEVSGLGIPEVVPPTEPDETIVCVPTPFPLATIPGIRATVDVAGNTRVLNGDGSNATMMAARWSSSVNGGHLSAQFKILLTEYEANLDVYRYGAQLVLEIAPGYDDAGKVLFTGYLDGPATSSEQIAELSAVGYQQILRDTKDPLLWQTWHNQDWSPTDSQPWGGFFRNDDSIGVHTTKGAMSWQIPKGQDINNGDTARIGFWMDDEVNVTRVAGTIRKNDPVPGGPAYSFKLHRFDAPNDPGSQQSVRDFGPTGTNEISNGANESNFHEILGVPKPAVTFTMERIGSSGETENSWRLWVTDARVNGDAYRDGRTPDDTYFTHNAAKDIAEAAGINDVTMVEAVGQNCLPLWSQSGRAWSDTLDHLTKILTGTHGWKWSVWDRNDSGELMFEFRDFGTNNVKWQTYAYTSDAVSIANIDRIADDLYSKIMVTFHTTSSHRLHRRTAAVVPNPFAGLDPPLDSRKRVYHLHIPEPLPPGATLPQEIADTLAAYYSEQQYGGTIQSVSLSDGLNSRFAGEARAGELISICDFPNDDGSTGRVFRILQVDATDDGATTISVGRNPNTLPRIMHRLHERAREHALHHQHH